MRKATLRIAEGQGTVLPSPTPTSPSAFPASTPLLAAAVVVQQAAPPSFVTDENCDQHGLNRSLFRRFCRAGLAHHLAGDVRVAQLDDVRRWIAANPHTVVKAPAADPIEAALSAAGLVKGGAR